ncbi:MAG: thioredoxin family protein [bacterium]|nr:thioredoxin family protein [bacterium]
MAITPSTYDKLKTGDAAPDFSLLGIDGKDHSLQDFSNFDGLLVIFMCNHCPYVKAKMQVMIDLQKKFKDQVALVGINSNDPDYPGEGMDNMKKLAMDRGINFTYLFDDKQEVARAYGATCTPDAFLFDKSRRLVFHGRINDAMEMDDPVREQTVEENIKKMLEGELIEKSFEPSVGCSIKWVEDV